MLDAIAAALNPIGTILGFLVAVGGLVLFGWRLRKQVLHVGERAERAATNSASAASTAEDTQRELEDTREALVISTRALEAATSALDKLRENHDDVWAALLRAESVQARLRLIEHAVADLEDARGEVPTKLISTRGGQHVEQ